MSWRFRRPTIREIVLGAFFAWFFAGLVEFVPGPIQVTGWLLARGGIVANPSAQPPPGGSAGLTVRGDASAGARFPVPQSGLYEVTILSGAYSPSPDAATNTWRTLLYLYVDDVSWAFMPPYSPTSSDLTPSTKGRIGILGFNTDMGSHDAAAARGLGSTMDLRLDAGHDLVFVPIDVQGAYGGNQGAVVVAIAFVHP